MFAGAALLVIRLDQSLRKKINAITFANCGRPLRLRLGRLGIPHRDGRVVLLTVDVLDARPRPAHAAPCLPMPVNISLAIGAFPVACDDVPLASQVLRRCPCVAHAAPGPISSS